MYNPQLKTFIQVVDTGSFTQASEKLYITPASVMKQMNALEEHIGIKLLERTNQGIALTQAGKVFYQEAIKIIDFSSHSIEKVRKKAGETNRVLKIGTSLLNPCRVFLICGNLSMKSI